jgi:modification methylase
MTMKTKLKSLSASNAATCYASSCGRVTLYHADNLTVLPDLRADLVVTSPPYNLGGRPWEHLGHWKAGDITGGKGKWENGCDANGVEYGEHQDAMPWAEYVEWQRETLRALWNCLGDAGAIYYNHKPRVIGVNLWTPLELIPEEVAIRQIITWARPGGVNYNLTAFVPTMEWVMLLAKPEYRLKSRGVSGLGDVWRMNPERNEHPAPFPVALPAKAIESSECETVLDPYMGSGTTGVAAIRAGKRFVGIEKDAGHYEAAKARIINELRQGDLFHSLHNAIGHPTGGRNLTPKPENE